ncbi:hypothetical protein SNEBB_000811 [Seison nebaliae]|nr:hypothetical protein SNEBB_000811 [Seison nebaliae]
MEEENDIELVDNRKRHDEDMEVEEKIIEKDNSEKKKQTKVQWRKVAIPKNRRSYLKKNWMKIMETLVNQLNLQVRYNTATHNVEMRTCEKTDDISIIQKACDFINAFALGFEIDDAITLIRLDDLFLESFYVTDVKYLKGDSLSRAIGRIAGHNGKTKYTIENVTKTRIVVADCRIHILGSYENIAVAKRSICNLIMGSPPSKIYGRLRSFASKGMKSF